MRLDLNRADPDRVAAMQASSAAAETQMPVERNQIAAIERLIRPYVRHTPTITIDAPDFGLDAAPLLMKLEFLQHTGSFKPRGAFANLLTRSVPAAGVAAASGGNHGAAVAYAAMRLGLRATIFVPRITSPAKLDRIRSYGAELVVAGDRYADALAASENFIDRTGALAVHAYDQRETIIGQGTVGLEIEEDAPDIDTLLVAVGGGGLIGGIAAWYAGRIRIVAVEPELAPTLHDALAAGRPIDAPAAGIAADSLAPRRVGELMFPIARRFVERSVLVSEEAIRSAQRTLWETLRIIAEPGGAAALAALLSGAYRPMRGERIAVLLCGANTAVVGAGGGS
jgi:threonine dehydratase